METMCFCASNLDKAQILVIGHDPRLQTSDTQARHAFFADYYFRPIPTQKNELAKYRLAEKTFSCVAYLTSHKYSAEQVLLTNLCNKVLPHAPKNKTVLIPRQEAEAGVKAIQTLLQKTNIKLIFAMSEQVNYWLQMLGFYTAVPDFLSKAEPMGVGIASRPPYYTPVVKKAFPNICGNVYMTSDMRKVIPILHTKNWPLTKIFSPAYQSKYDGCISFLKALPKECA